MGLFNEVKRQFVARPDEAKDFIVYKWPDRNIRLLTQLTVQQDELALFFKDGKVVGTLGPGRHNLDGKDIPFLGALIDAATGGNILISELYFVSTRAFTNLPFGGKIDTLEEPNTKLFIELRVFGEYAMTVEDSEQLIVNLIGTQNIEANEEVTAWMTSQVMKVLRQVVAEKVQQKTWEMVSIAQYGKQLEEAMTGLINNELTRFGIKVTQFGNVTITMRDEDAETLKQFRRDSMYAATQGAADAAMKVGIGKGMEKGTAGDTGAGVGLGVGIALGSDLLKKNQ